MSSLFAPAVNFFILLGFLYFKLRAPVSAFVAERQKSIAAELDGVREQSRLAKEKYAEFSKKLGAVHAEVASLRHEGRQEIETLSKQIQVEAKRVAADFLADASQATQALYLEFQAKLYRDFVEQVIVRSTVLVKEQLTDADRMRMRSEFASQMERAS